MPAIHIQDVKATGYDPYEYFFTTKYHQGGRTVYSLDWSVRELVTFLPKPDPDKPVDLDATQRRIYPAHARGFADYVRGDKGWVSPPLLLRAPDIFKFQRVEGLETGSTSFGLLAVPKDSKAEIHIVDGQHRTLGFHWAWESLSADIEAARVTVARCKEVQDQVALSAAQKKLDGLLTRREELGSERVSVQIVIAETPETARRVFVDINDNAKGITGAVKSRFDDRKVITRALNIVLRETPLLHDRVDIEQDRIAAGSKYLLGAKHVADILRALTVGGGRIGKRVEDEVNEKVIVKAFEDFIDTLKAAFPELTAVAEDRKTPAELRSESLLGSNVMLRGMAQAWYNLKLANWSTKDIREGLETMAPYMGAPVLPDPKDTWFATGLFPAAESGTYSPTSRAQDFKALAKFIEEAVQGKVVWARVTR